MAITTGKGRLHACVTILLATAALILVVLVTFGIIEIRYSDRSDPVAASDQPSVRLETEKPSTSVPQIARVEDVDLAFDMLGTRYTGHLFRYSGTLVDCELEVETDGEKTVVASLSGSALKRADRKDSEPSNISGYILCVGRPAPLAPKEDTREVLDPADPRVVAMEIWDLTLRRNDGHRPTEAGQEPIPLQVERKGIAMPEFAWQDDKTTRGFGTFTTGRRLGVKPVELTGELVLWESRIADEVAAKEGKYRQIICLKCRPVAVEDNGNQK